MASFKRFSSRIIKTILQKAGREDILFDRFFRYGRRKALSHGEGLFCDHWMGEKENQPGNVTLFTIKVYREAFSFSIVCSIRHKDVTLPIMLQIHLTRVRIDEVLLQQELSSSYLLRQPSRLQSDNYLILLSRSY